MKIQTLERYIKRTSIPYGDLLARAKRGGLDVKEIPDTNGTVIVRDSFGNEMTLYFESTLIYEENMSNGLICSEYNYPKNA